MEDWSNPVTWLEGLLLLGILVVLLGPERLVRWLGRATAASMPGGTRGPGGQSDEHTLRALVAAGQKIPAIKAYRAMTGSSLKDAKAAVEAFARGDWSALDRAPARLPAADTDVRSLVEQGNLLGAIKAYRLQTGCELKEAKEAIEQLKAEMNR